MFRRALRLGSRVAVASTAAVVPTAAACFQGNLLSDSRTPGCIEINDFGAVPEDDDVALADASEQVPANDPAENAVAVAVN